MKNKLKKYLFHIGTDWSNKDDVLKKVSNSGMNLQFADSGLRDDSEVVITAFENNPKSIIYASRNIRNDKDTMLQLVETRPEYVQYVSDKLKKDEDIAFESIPGGEDYIDDSFLYDKNFALMIAKHKGHIIYEFEEDKEVIKATQNYFIKELKFDSTYGNFESAHKSLKNDKDFMLKIVKISGLELQYGSDEIKDDEVIAEAAIRSWMNSIMHTSDRIKHSKKFHKIYMESTDISTHKDLGFDKPNKYTKMCEESDKELAKETLEKILDGTYYSY